MHISALCEGVIRLRNINGFSFILKDLREKSTLFSPSTALLGLLREESAHKSRYAVRSPLSVI